MIGKQDIGAGPCEGIEVVAVRLEVLQGLPDLPVPDGNGWFAGHGRIKQCGRLGTGYPVGSGGVRLGNPGKGGRLLHEDGPGRAGPGD